MVRWNLKAQAKMAPQETPYSHLVFTHFVPYVTSIRSYSCSLSGCLPSPLALRCHFIAERFLVPSTLKYSSSGSSSSHGKGTEFRLCHCASEVTVTKTWAHIHWEVRTFWPILVSLKDSRCSWEAVISSEHPQTANQRQTIKSGDNYSTHQPAVRAVRQ